MDCQHCPNKDNVTPMCYRQAADKVWDMANEYKKQGILDLADVLFELAQEIHDLARSKELHCCSSNSDASK